jgi:catechol 2,3-dioxygenase-like lactoylglutathione lyase family enzyme
MDMSGSESTGVRLRQAVLVTRDLEPAYERLRDALGLGEPFRDPGVGSFGLHNVVCALGEDFLEIVSPTQDGTAAGRHLERRGEGGYMLIFQLDDLASARQRAEALGVRTAWSIDIDDISASHLHPADLGGTIVSIDRPLPPESWRWGGPDWIGHAGEGAPGRLAGVTVRVPDPDSIAARWAEVLGLKPDLTMLRLDRDQHVAFEQGDEGLAEIAVELPSGAAEPLAFGAARVVQA